MPGIRRSDRSPLTTIVGSRGKGLDDRETVALLRQHILDALNRQDGDISETREKTLNLWRGGPIGDEDPAHARFRTREVFEYEQSVVPGLMSIFMSARRPIEFPPLKPGPEEEERAEQQTDVVDYHIFRRGNAHSKISAALQAGILQPNSYLKVHCLHAKRMKHHRYAELRDDQLVNLLSEDRVWKEGVKITELEPGSDGAARFSFEGTEISSTKEYRYDIIPPEQMLVDRTATTPDLDVVWEEDRGFLCHVANVPRTELLLRGYDPKKLDQVSGEESAVRFNDERVNRFNREEEHPRSSAIADDSMKMYTVYECYAHLDRDGSGIADSWRIVLIGDEIFEEEKVSYQPFISFSMVPIAFKHAGLAPGEVMADLQALKTKLVRLMLDDAYRNEARRVIVSEDAKTPNTFSDIDDPEGNKIRVRGRPQDAVMAEQPFSIIGDLMPVTQYADDMVKRRSGIAPDTALNPDVLSNATAHGMLASLDRTSSRLMHMGRILAETLFTKMGVKFHQILRLEQDSEMTRRIHGKWIAYNPADWEERTEMEVATGLGFNSKAEVLQALAQLLGLQKEALAQGLSDPQKIFHTLRRLVEDADLGFVEQYFVEPDPRKGWKPPQPPPDPQLEAVKAQLEIAKLDAGVKRLQMQSDEKLGLLDKANKEREIAVDAARIEGDIEIKLAEVSDAGALNLALKRAEWDQMREETRKIAAEIDKLRAEARNLQAEARSTSEGETSNEEG